MTKQSPLSCGTPLSTIFCSVCQRRRNCIQEKCCESRIPVVSKTTCLPTKRRVFKTPFQLICPSLSNGITTIIIAFPKDVDYVILVDIASLDLTKVFSEICRKYSCYLQLYVTADFKFSLLLLLLLLLFTYLLSNS